MSLPVFRYESAAQASIGSDVVLDGPVGHHAATVKRLRRDESVVLTDGHGTALDARVRDVGRREVRLVVEASRRTDSPSLSVTVVQAVAKGDRGERAVELMTEVGVSQIVPWQAQRSVSRWTGDKAAKGRARWQATAAAAALQSRRLWWPEIGAVAQGEDVAALVARSSCGFVLHEDSELSLTDELAHAATPTSGEVVLVVGPEGGITTDELDVFIESGAAPVRLGPTVLRTSTAGVVAATLVLARSKEWRAASTSHEGAERD